MATESRLDRLLRMKRELEQLGCKVTITPGDGEDVITIRIIYPEDVPPPIDDKRIPW